MDYFSNHKYAPGIHFPTAKKNSVNSIKIRTCYCQGVVNCSVDKPVRPPSLSACIFSGVFLSADIAKKYFIGICSIPKKVCRRISSVWGCAHTVDSRSLKNSLWTVDLRLLRRHCTMYINSRHCSFGQRNISIYIYIK